jgi:hypothetical protein
VWGWSLVGGVRSSDGRGSTCRVQGIIWEWAERVQLLRRGDTGME